MAFISRREIMLLVAGLVLFSLTGCFKNPTQPVQLGGELPELPIIGGVNDTSGLDLTVRADSQGIVISAANENEGVDPLNCSSALYISATYQGQLMFTARANSNASMMSTFVGWPEGMYVSGKTLTLEVEFTSCTGSKKKTYTITLP
jgi:hypothetical protein